jgi:hypothetical protein
MLPTTKLSSVHVEQYFEDTQRENTATASRKYLTSSAAVAEAVANSATVHHSIRREHKIPATLSAQSHNVRCIHSTLLDQRQICHPC